MKLTTAFLVASSAASLELLPTSQTGTWSGTATNGFENAAPANQNQAYKHSFVGKPASNGGGLCAVGTAHLEAVVNMKNADPTVATGNYEVQINERGNSAGLSMRADAASDSMGYQCLLDAHQGMGMQLKRDGQTIRGCPRTDSTGGVYNKYTSGCKWDGNACIVSGPYTFDNICQIQERQKDFAGNPQKDQDYTMRMEIEENTDLNTVTVSCFLDGVRKLHFTDPCPLTTGGEFAIDAKYQTSFRFTDYTDTSCDDVPVPAQEEPSLADGLEIQGLGRTSAYWVSKNLAEANTVAHRYAGGCNNGYLQNQGGLNREGGGRSNDAINVAALKSGECVKDGFLEVDVKVLGDYAAHTSKVGTDGHVKSTIGTDGNARYGYAGIAMRVDTTGTDTGTYDTFGYMCQIDGQDGQVKAFRGNNGYSGSHNDNYLGGGYLTGKYKCSACTCVDKADCDQFSFDADGNLYPGAAHTLRMEVTTDESNINTIKCFLNGTETFSVEDKRSGKHNWFPRSARSPGPGDSTSGTNQCGDFGVVTSDQDIVEYIVKNYTGYTPADTTPSTIPVDVEFEVAGETEESFTEEKQTAFIDAIAAALGIDASLITLTVGLKANPIAGPVTRRLGDGDLLITVTIAMEPEQMVGEVEKLESPALVAAVAASAQITATFRAFKPAKLAGGDASPLCARCKWDSLTQHIVVEHFINAQKHGEKGLQHKCYHLGDNCVCKCKANAFDADSYREGNALLGRYITPGPNYGTPGLNWDGVTDVDGGN